MLCHSKNVSGGYSFLFVRLAEGFEGTERSGADRVVRDRAVSNRTPAILILCVVACVQIETDPVPHFVVDVRTPEEAEMHPVPELLKGASGGFLQAPGADELNAVVNTKSRESSSARVSVRVLTVAPTASVSAERRPLETKNSLDGRERKGICGRLQGSSL